MSNSRKYTSIWMIFIYVIEIHYRIVSIANEVFSCSSFSTERQNWIPMISGLWRNIVGVLIYWCYTIANIMILTSITKVDYNMLSKIYEMGTNYISFTRTYKRILLHCVLRRKTVGGAFYHNETDIELWYGLQNALYWI